MEIKNEVLYRVYFLLFGLAVPLALVLFYRTIQIGIVDGETWRQAGQELYVQLRPVEAEQGNILSDDGSLMATSIPFFDIYMDPTSPSDADFEANVDTLGHCISLIDTSYTAGGFATYLREMRAQGKKYVLIKKKAPFTDKLKIEQFPLFNLGWIKGGFIAERRSERRYPYGWLAQRTIGYIREGAQPVGIEGAFSEILGGQAGQQLMIRVDSKEEVWLPLEDLSQVEPQSGDDVVTTIDINLQDAAENALYRALNWHDAEWGVAVVMEVKTGAVKAIANLGKIENGYAETYNHAVATAIEPGSTFKLASIMALLEDGYVKLTDTVEIDSGATDFFGFRMEDASFYSKKMDTTTVKRVFEISSNVGIAKLVQKYYGSKTKANKNQGAQRFINRLKDFNLHLPTGIEIAGEANPYVKEAYSEEDQWSAISLPWMSTGYELKITPLQLLTFFNTVANDGVHMKPYLVQEIRKYGRHLKTLPSTVIDRQIASPATILQAHELLKAVVDTGTAVKLKTPAYSFAGKTGTAQINYRRTAAGKTFIGGYQGSFAGYFPAENPQYSCIVVIYNPRQNGYYGSDVAGPVFREIADYCMSTNWKNIEPVNGKVAAPLKTRQLPQRDIGNKADLMAVLDFLEMPVFGNPESEMAVVQAKSDSLFLERRTVTFDQRVPNVVGMGLRDALYAMESNGLRVEVSGYGKVVLQSLLPGTKSDGQVIKLTLN